MWSSGFIADSRRRPDDVANEFSFIATTAWIISRTTVSLVHTIVGEVGAKSCRSRDGNGANKGRRYSGYKSPAIKLKTKILRPYLDVYFCKTGQSGIEF